MWRLKPFFVLIILCFLDISPVVAQQESRDSTYIRNFKEVFNIQAIGQYRPMELQVQGKESEQSIHYRPNSRPLVGIGGSIINIGFAFLFKLPESFGRDPEVYGKTRAHDFAVNMFLPQFTFDFQYQYYEGLYVSRVRVPDVAKGQIVHKPDLVLEGFGLNGIYLFNKGNLSLGAVFTHSSRQLRSSGSFVTLASLKHTRLSAGGALVPEKYMNDFGTSSHFEQGAFTAFSVMPGYAQTFIVNNFYLNFVLAVGPDLQYNVYSLPDADTQKWKVQGKMNFRAGIGYDNGKFFTGIFYLDRRNRFSVGDLNVVHNASLIRFSIGHRFQETSWMQDIKDWTLYQRIMNPLNN